MKETDTLYTMTLIPIIIIVILGLSLIYFLLTKKSNRSESSTNRPNAVEAQNDSDIILAIALALEESKPNRNNGYAGSQQHQFSSDWNRKDYGFLKKPSREGWRSGIIF